MKSLEEEANQELGKRLREKLEGYKAPVKDQVRSNIFAGLDRSTYRFYWVIGIGSLLLITGYFLGDRLLDHKFHDKAVLFDSGKTEAASKKGNHTKPGSESIGTTKNQTDRSYLEKEPIGAITSGVLEKKMVMQRSAVDNVHNKKRDGDRSASRLKFKSLVNPKTDLLNHIKESTEKEVVKFDAETNIKSETVLVRSSMPVNLIASCNRIAFSNSLKIPTIPQVIQSNLREVVKIPGIMDGVKAVFSAATMQTFQRINLSQSGSERIQNFQFTPLLSSKSLSYKFTAGLEKKHTQLLLNYQYLRSWNEFEIGTNQVIAEQTSTNQYTMKRIGEKHIEDDRSHLIGIGLRQSFMLPQQILPNSNFNLGIDYTRILPISQDLVWGNLGICKQIYQSGKNQLEIGPYFQYSFVQLRVAGQSWKYRPYQFGISVNLKVK